MISTRAVAWLKGARKEFEKFPPDVQLEARIALTIAARSGKADTAKPFKGIGGGIFEIALQKKGNAYRLIYAVQLGSELWVIDAFQKKSRTGIKTPQVDIDRIRERIKRLKENLR